MLGLLGLPEKFSPPSHMKRISEDICMDMQTFKSAATLCCFRFRHTGPAERASPFDFSEEQQMTERSRGEAHGSVWRAGVLGARGEAEMKPCKLICCSLQGELGSQNSPNPHVNVRHQKWDIVWKLNKTTAAISSSLSFLKRASILQRSCKTEIVMCLK